MCESVCVLRCGMVCDVCVMWCVCVSVSDGWLYCGLDFGMLSVCLVFVDD